MRSWTSNVMGMIAVAALVLVPVTALAQQAEPRPPADSVAARPAVADTGAAAKPPVDSLAQKPPAADTGWAKKASADSLAQRPIPTDTGAPRRASADSATQKAAAADTGSARRTSADSAAQTAAAADTGSARRVVVDSAAVKLLGSDLAAVAGGPGEAMERGVIKRPDPLGAFTKEQTQYSRVLAARIEKRFEIKKLYRERGIEYPAAEVFIRIFKRERELELWVRPDGDQQFSLLKTYPICAMAGELGPKRTEGDGQTPEGFYFIDRFNPTSEFHLSLHLDYPNRADRALWKSPNPGGEIFIHGGCNSAGCMAVTDDAIKEIYWIAVEARSAGQNRIPVHVFPTRLSDNSLAQLVRVFQNQPELTRFWSNLKTGYDYFEENRRVPSFSVTPTGRYAMKNQVLGTPVAGTPSPDAPVANTRSGGGLLGEALPAHSSSPKAMVTDSTARSPVLSRPIPPDSVKRGGN